MQIVHNLIFTDNKKTTEAKIKVKQAIISVLFAVSDFEGGDTFLDGLGISRYNTNENGDLFIPEVNSELKRKKVIPGTYDAGLHYVAFNGLLNLLNLNGHLYYYYGSETKPPCNEDVLWIVFGQPRSISKHQLDYLVKVLGKTNNGEKIQGTPNPGELYGNKRELFVKSIVYLGL